MMNTVDRLNAVIDYVEKHITENLDLNQLAEIAQYSLYDFQRMFGFIAEMSIAEYIRKRRLTLAGLDIKYNDMKVIDAALKYGYESPSAFARAFQSFHDITPSAARKSAVRLKTLPRLIFQISVKEVPQMVRAEKISVNGKEYEASYFGEQDISSWSTYAKREFWRLENAYDDFKGKERTRDVLPYNNYNMNIDLGQVFAIDYTNKDGSVERKYYISDGTVWRDMPSTREVRVGETKPQRVDKLTVNGKEYEAPYFGEQDLSHLNWPSIKREFWRLENAYDDFKDKERTNNVLPYNNYNMNIDLEQVFVIDYTNKDGSVERNYYISDGTVWQDMLSTCEVRVE